MEVDKHELNRGFKIAVGADHAGRDLAFFLMDHLRNVGTRGHTCTLFVPQQDEKWDYADPAQAVSKLVQQGEVDRGLLICGTGIGMSMAANRFVGVRCALVHDIQTAILSRDHNNANILALGARQIEPQQAWLITSTWLQTPFGWGRHEPRINKIDQATAHGNGN
jgi:ribose 5-phosphate isomerase B